jgi:hypothetical protein
MHPEWAWEDLALSFGMFMGALVAGAFTYWGGWDRYWVMVVCFLIVLIRDIFKLTKP